MHPIIQEAIAPFTAGLHQKDEKVIQTLPDDDNIYVVDWHFKTGYLLVDLHKKWWAPDVIAYEKEFNPDHFKEYCEQAIGVVGSFEEWWRAWSTEVKDKIVQGFINKNRPMLDKEIDEYHYKEVGKSTKTSS